MDILKPFIRHFFYDFYSRRDGVVVKPILKELLSSQYWSEERLRENQLARLTALLKYCYENNDFYRSRFDASGFHPEDFRDFADLKKIPVLTKDDIRRAGDGLFSRNFSRENTMHKRTGGSTGVPVHNYFDYTAAAVKKAATMRHNGWAGLIPGARLAAVWGDTEKKLPWKVRLRNALTERAFYLDTLKFDEPHILTFIGQIRKYRPEVIMGHAHSVYRLAEFCRENKIGDIRFNGIITTAMVLSTAERQVIEAVFESPVFNRYGCEELSIISSECEAHSGMHIFAEGLYVELDGPDQGLPRPLIITDLENRAMPMIRYEIGDYGILEPGPCSCGRGLPRFREISGRTADFLYSPEGRPIFGISILDTFVIHIPGLKQVQIIQDKYDHLDFYIVKDGKFSEECPIRVKKTVAEIFGAGMRCDISYVDKIPQTERGKYRFSICKINPDEKPRPVKTSQ